MNKFKIKRKVGRPEIPIDKKTFEKLCMLQCTKKEIADFFDCSDDTITNWCLKNYVDEDGNPMNFSDTYEKKSAGGKISLRRMQWKSAENGNVSMQIFLGKQYLGQKDEKSFEISNVPMIVDDIPGEEIAVLNEEGD